MMFNLNSVDNSVQVKQVGINNCYLHNFLSLIDFFYLQISTSFDFKLDLNPKALQRPLDLIISWNISQMDCGFYFLLFFCFSRVHMSDRKISRNSRLDGKK